MEAGAGESTTADSPRALGRPGFQHLPQAYSTDDPRRLPFLLIMGLVVLGAVALDTVLPHEGWWDEISFAVLLFGALMLQRLLRKETRIDASGIDLRTPWGRRIHVDWPEVLNVELGQGPLSRSLVLTPRGAVPLYGMSRCAVQQLRQQMLMQGR